MNSLVQSVIPMSQFFANPLNLHPAFHFFRCLPKSIIQGVVIVFCGFIFGTASAQTPVSIDSLVADSPPGEVKLQWLQNEQYRYTLYWSTRSTTADALTNFYRLTEHDTDIDSPYFFGPFPRETTVYWSLWAHKDGQPYQHSTGQTWVSEDGLTVESANVGGPQWHLFKPISITFTQIIQSLDTGTLTIQPTKADFSNQYQYSASAFKVLASSGFIRINNRTLSINPNAFYRSGVNRIGTNLRFDTEYEIRLDRLIAGAANQAKMHDYRLITFRTPPLSLFSSQTLQIEQGVATIDPALGPDEKQRLDFSRQQHKKYVLDQQLRTFRGRGVNIAVMDEGILKRDITNHSVAWRLKQIDDQFLRPLGQSQPYNHGTLMARFMLDYAPLATLLDFHIFAGPAHTHYFIQKQFNELNIPPYFYANLARSLGADILNVSLISPQVSHRLEDWAEAIHDGLVVSKSLGNNFDHPNVWHKQQCLDPANLLPYFYDLKSADGAIVTLQAAYFNNVEYKTIRARADDAKSYTLTVLETGLGATSQAAATFSGILATLMEASRYYNRSYTPKQIVALLFETAIDIGEPGVDDLFGHGLIDLEAALVRIENGHAPSSYLYHSLSPHHPFTNFRCSSPPPS